MCEYVRVITVLLGLSVLLLGWDVPPKTVAPVAVPQAIDDTVFLQRLIDRNMVVSIPPGRYDVDSLTIAKPKVINADGVVIVGKGEVVMKCARGVIINGLTVNSLGTETKWLLRITGPDFRASQCTFAGGTEGCVSMDQSWCSSFSQCIFGVFGKWGISAFNSSNTLTVTACRFDGFNPESIGIAFGSAAGTFHGVTLQTLATGIWLAPSQSASISGCYFEKIRDACVRDNPQPASIFTSRGISITGCFLCQPISGKPEIQLDHTDGGSVTACQTRGQKDWIRIGKLSTNCSQSSNSAT